jgi:membrane protein insertase Oxa1/YidC/SpoIIIJ
MWEETTKVHQREGIKVLGGGSVLGMLLQVPLFIGLFSAVRRGLTNSGRFLWIKDLMKSDPLLAIICAVLAAISAAFGANTPDSQRTATILIPATLTLLFLWRMSAGLTIYSFGSGAVGLLQSAIVSRRRKRMPAYE